MLFSLLAIFVAITVLMIVLTDHLNFFNWLLFSKSASRPSFDTSESLGSTE